MAWIPSSYTALLPHLLILLLYTLARVLSFYKVYNYFKNMNTVPSCDITFLGSASVALLYKVDQKLYILRNHRMLLS